MASQYFQPLSSLFRSQVVGNFANSGEFQATSADIELALLRADRLIAACDRDPAHGRMQSELCEQLRSLRELYQANQDYLSPTIGVLKQLEVWLKAILWLAKPERWREQTEKTAQARESGEKAMFGLNEVMQDLQLLSGQDMQRDHVDIADPVCSSIAFVRPQRNEVTHDGSLIPPHLRDRMVQCTLTAFIAPLVRYGADIDISLQRLVASPIGFDSLEVLAKQVESERRGHLDRFEGRAEWIEDLSGKLLNDFRAEGGYILLTATEGTGKSALASKLSQFFATRSPVLGPHSTEINRVASWLPGVILHMGKASNIVVEEIVPFLTKQIECQLVRSTGSNAAPQQFGIEDNLGMASTRPTRDSERSRRTDENKSPTYGEMISEEFDDKSNGYMLSRRYFHDALERLVRERGSVILIIDAIEEISESGDKLAFLPERLPAGVACLMTSRPQTQAERYVRSRLRNVECVELKQLTREELPLITSVEDSTAKGKQFNDEVMSKSNGLANIVSTAGREVKRKGTFEGIAVNSISDSFFDAKAREWLNGPKLNAEILGLLAILEPVTPVRLADIQSYLMHMEYDVELSEIVRSLEEVSVQLQGLNVKRIKLAEKPFAEHVRGSLYSPLDLFRRFKRLVDWLINDPDVPPALFAKMFMLWSSDDLLPIERRRLSKKHRSYISSLPEQLAESGNKRLLNATASAVGSEFNAGHSLAIDCLRRSAKLGSTFGKRMFSNVLSAEVSEEVKEEARTFLKEVANEDDPGAMLMLGNRLIAGVGFDRDVEQGEYWLDRSAQLGHVRSMESLGGRMVNQDGITGKVNEGLRWLEKAAENKSSSAAAMLGQLYVEGDNVQPNPEKGKELLEMAIAEGHLPAIRLLSVKCFEGREIPLDTERGLALLEQGIEKEDANCIRTLAKRHFLGDGVPADHQRALELLEQGAKKGFNNCRRYLAQELIEAQHIPKADTGSAIALLQDAIADGDAIAMEVLADFYLDREPTKAAEGRSLLMEAIEKGSSYARKNLAERLLEGNGIQSDVEKGVAILEEGIERRDTRSIRALASYLFDEATKSEGDSTRFAKAIQLFRDAIQYDDPFAQVEFALRLLGEPSLSQHHAEARTLIERRAHEEDSTAQRELARILIDSDIDKDKTTATKWLLRAAEGGDLPAMVDLAKCYQKGNGVSKDLGAAQSWLFKATMYEYAPALAYLAQELVTGEHFDRDEDQAKCLLEKTGRLHPGIVYNTGYSFFKLDMTDWSARCFLIAQGYGHSDAANNLAFLIRRDLVPADLDAPHPLTLLKAGIESGDEFPLVNAALCYAAGLLKMKTNWRKADELISRVSRFENLSERLDDETANHPAVFWSGVLKDEANAAEGHLVVGWLAGHGKLEDPEGLSVRKRLELAVEGGWSVPKWLIEKF